ncbi:MAG: pyridoxal 5'-phosphate synthase glutaminase subunit PdxT [Candidatus Saliniplasma sp.]
MKIGILSVQGAFLEHEISLRKTADEMDVEANIIRVKSAENILNLDGLIIPGGESSTISRLIEKFGIRQTIIEKAEEKMPIMGTCAGSILLATDGDNAVQRSDTSLLSLMDMAVKRNAFGRQRYSFECRVGLQNICENFPAVFIRAPVIDKCYNDCRPLGRVDGGIIAAEQENLLSLVFHPELTEDLRIHEYFIEKVKAHL